MGKPVVQTSFFASARKEVRLNKYELLEVIIDGEEKKRSKLNVEIPLSSSQSVVGMPSWISNPLGEIGKDDSLVSRMKLEAVCKGMTIDIFPTEKGRRRTLMSTGVKIGNFSLVATGEGEDREVVLEAVIYVPANIQLHQWAWDHIHKVFFVDFEYSQSEFEFDGKAAGAEEDDDEDEPAEIAAAGEEQDDDPDSAASIAARAKKPFNATAIQNAVN